MIGIALHWRIACLVIGLLLCSVARGEVVPSRKTPQLFPDRPLFTPSNWNVRTLPVGEKFRLTVSHPVFQTTIETPDGPRRFSELPWAKQAIVRIMADQLKTPEVFRDLLENKTNPIMFFGEGYFAEPLMYPGQPPEKIDEYFEFVLKAKQAFGSRFLGFDYGEWTWGGVDQNKPMRELPLSCELLKLGLPQDRDQARVWWDKRYDMVFDRYQAAGIPIFSWNNSSFNHYEARKGISYTGNEIDYVNPAFDSTFIAFSRGASRQYDIPWGSYAAGFGGHFGHSDFGGKSPDERQLRSGVLRGGYTAVPMHEQRQALYSVYMAGGNFLIKESDGGQGMLSGYDPTTIDQLDPRIISLAETKVYAGPYAQMCAEFYDNIVQKHDRGTPYTPIALLFDKNHGLAFKYSKTLAIGAVPYTRADEQMRSVLNTVFPFESSTPHLAAGFPAGPFGEVFDVITTDASAEVLGSYRALVLVGQPRVEPKLAVQLKKYVENGGVLFAACEQLTPELWSLAGISDTGELGQDTSYLRASDFYVQQQRGFEYHKVNLQGAEPLYVAGNPADRVWPVATLHRVGKGSVIVGTPVWMNVKDDPTLMHGVISDILGMISDETAPVRVYGNSVKVMHNRNGAGWIVTLMNNRLPTIAYPGFRPAIRERETAAVILKPQFESDAVSEWITGQPLALHDGQVSLLVPPGEIRIVEFRDKSVGK